MNDTEARKQIVRCVWFGFHSKSENITLRSGEPVEIYSPGWWNVEDGATFLRAELETDDGKLSPDNPMSVDCFVSISEVPENRECDVVVVFFDDDSDRQFSDPVIVLENFCDEDIIDLLYGE